MLRAYVVLILFCFCNVAQAGLFDDEEARRRITEFKTQVETNQQATDARIQKLEELQRSLADLLGQLESVKADIAKLRGQMEVLGNDADITQKRQKDLYIDLDSRLRKFEQGAATPNANAAATEPAKTTADTVSETKAYENALNAFKVGSYQTAIASFQNFLKNYPQSTLAPSAQYWIGNAYSALRDFRAAIANQQKVISNWPDSPKVADAMLNIATCQIELGDTRSAKKTLENLIKSHPSTPAAELAKQRLAKLK